MLSRNAKMHVFVVFMFFLSSCTSLSIFDYKSNGIELEPLLNLDLPLQTEEDLGNILDIERLESLEQVSFTPGQSLSPRGLEFQYRIQEEPENEIFFTVHLFLNRDIKAAREFTQKDCNNPYRDHPVDRSGEGIVNGTSYYFCVYKLQLIRGGAESFRKPLGYYRSDVYIQKGNMTISISERTETLDRTLSNEAIKQLAGLIKTPVED